MVPFIILLLMPMLIQYVALGNKNIDYEKKNKQAICFFFGFLTLLIMLRHESVGNDTRNYMGMFDMISLMDWNALKKLTIEFGFASFNKIVSVFTDNAQIFLSVTALVTVGMMFFTYRRLCLDPSLTIVLFCILSTFIMLFSGIRQMLAVGVGFIAYELTRNKKFLLFLGAVAVAMLFHTSAFMLIFMYPLYHVRITKNWMLAVVPLLMVVYVFNEQIFAFLNTILSQYTRFEGQITSTGSFTMLLLFSIFTVFAFLTPDESRLDQETIGLRNFLLFSLVIQMFAPLHMLAMRMNYYYIIFIPLLMPKIIACRSERWNQVAIVGRHIMVVFFLVYFFWHANSGNSLHVFPYHFFWENVW